MRILVTGAGAGLGRNAALALTAAGHDVIVHVRARARLNPDDSWAGVVTGDLTDLDQVRDVAAQANAYGVLDAVIHNAGTISPAEVFPVNTVAPFALTALMRKPDRLIYLSSGMHRSGSTDLTRIDRRQVTYSDSKLYVTTLALAFAHRWDGTVSHAVDPGWVPTRMGGLRAPDELTAGHETQVWVATHEVNPATGGYWHHRAVQRPHPVAQDPAFQAALSRKLEGLTGITIG